MIHSPTHTKGNTLDLLITNIDDHIFQTLLLKITYLLYFLIMSSLPLMFELALPHLTREDLIMS